jgi:8-oxo-dGTP pyrophosphatase MutT (NUDIX family)
LILTLRSKKVETHKGQISLPGGVQEENESLAETALREANEEIGVLPEIVEIIGKLSTIYVPYSGFKIYPYVGWTKSIPNLKASAEEVEKIIFASITELLNNDNQRKKTTALRGIPVTMPYFNLNNEKVWGATSMILSEFKQLIS